MYKNTTQNQILGVSTPVSPNSAYFAYSAVKNPLNQTRRENEPKTNQKRITVGNQQSKANQKRIKPGSKPNRSRHDAEPPPRKRLISSVSLHIFSKNW
jgi:hypothetical protein